MKRSLDIAATGLTVLLLLGFAALSLRGLIDPQSASARFGTAVSDSAGTLFYRVYLSRNLVIVAAGAMFLLTRHWTALSILLTADRGVAVVRHERALGQRHHAAVVPSGRIRAYRDRRSAFVAKGARTRSLTRWQWRRDAGFCG